VYNYNTLFYERKGSYKGVNIFHKHSYYLTT